MGFRFRRRRRQVLRLSEARAEPFTLDDTVVLSREAEAESRRNPWRWFWFVVTAVIGGVYLFVRW